MEIIPSSGDAASDVLPVILEVHGEEAYIALGAPVGADLLDHFLPLLYGRHKRRNRIVADRHIMEIEAETCALFRYHANELLIRDRLDILRGIADGGSEDDPVLLEKIHSLHAGLIMT